MTRFRKKTLRKMPSVTREIAQLANEMASVQTRLSNRIPALASMEMMANASNRVFCNDPAHAVLVDAAVDFVKAVDDPDLGLDERAEALAALKVAARHFDLDKLFEDYAETSKQPDGAGGRS